VGTREREGEGVSDVADASWLLGLSGELERLRIHLCLQWSDLLPLQRDPTLAPLKSPQQVVWQHLPPLHQAQKPSESILMP